MNTTKQKGLITELQCELAFSNIGIVLSKPIVEDSRYDYIADLNGNFIRIQCKTCAVSEDGNYIKFAARSTQVNTQENKTKKYSKKEIDYFYTYYDNQSYLVPVEECSVDKKLRLKNINMKNMSRASDYELEYILKTKESFEDFKYNEIHVINKSTPQNTCIDCGTFIYNSSIRCKECNKKI